MLTFFLGTHQPGWLATASVALFVSDRRLRGYRTLPRAAAPWALDSGGFTELQHYGTWDRGPSPREYADRVRCYRDEIGGLRRAAPQDWMCEPAILRGGTFGGQRFAGTGLTVAEHQHRTVANYLQLREIAPDLPFVPVVQGWTVPDYLRCVDLYERAGVDLSAAPVVGVGSVCRRQGTGGAAAITAALHGRGVRNLHGFGVKTLGLALYADRLASADSMAWSMAARREPPLPGCRHSSCANCQRYALRWRQQVLDALPERTYTQDGLFDLSA